MEDTLYLGRGRPVEGNDPLVARAVQLAADLDLAIASVEEAEKQLSLAPA